MVALFEAYWRAARPIPAGPDGGDESEFSAMEIATLRLLASGAKDEAVARQLGVSVRTVSGPSQRGLRRRRLRLGAGQ